MKHLNIERRRPKIGVFDFTGCEGCELQLANKEDSLGAFLSAIEVVSFREVSSDNGSDYTVALIDGAIARPDEVELVVLHRRREVAHRFGDERRVLIGLTERGRGLRADALHVPGTIARGRSSEEIDTLRENVRQLVAMLAAPGDAG